MHDLLPPIATVAARAANGALEAPLDAAADVGGVGVGAAAGLLLVALVLARVRRPLPGAGLAMAAAGLLALELAESAQGGSSPGLGAVAVAAAGGWLGRATRLPLAPRAALVLPGAYLAVDAARAEGSGVLWPTVVAAAVLAALAGDADESLARSTAGPPLLAASVAGMYGAVPETGQILPVLVVVVPVALAGAPLGRARLGAAGSAAIVVLLAAVVAAGGWARPASIVGALACLGVLALEPVARRLTPGTAPWPPAWWAPPVAWLVGVHVVVVALASRVAGVGEEVVAAVVVSALTGGAGLAVLTWLRRPAGVRTAPRARR
jgi:hypothetical protein